ncbi:MAG: hypothetical protein J6U54_04990 [Clostridiales bacterium]|nr:hypothetical protein [Clostridiales bacterium]
MDEPMYMITTTDNPYDPRTHMDEWFAWDITHGWHIESDGSIHLGYYTSAYLDKVANTTDELTPAIYWHAINQAIDEILEFDLTGKYIKLLVEE